MVWGLPTERFAGPFETALNTHRNGFDVKMIGQILCAGRLLAGGLRRGLCLRWAAAQVKLNRAFDDLGARAPVLHRSVFDLLKYAGIDAHANEGSGRSFRHWIGASLAKRFCGRLSCGLVMFGEIVFNRPVYDFRSSPANGCSVVVQLLEQLKVETNANLVLWKLRHDAHCIAISATNKPLACISNVYTMLIQVRERFWCVSLNFHSCLRVTP